jgi:hypothetical protein
VNDIFIAAQTSVLEFIQILESIFCFYIDRDGIIRVLLIEFFGDSFHVVLEIIPYISVTRIPIDVAETGNSERLPVILIYRFIFYNKTNAILIKKGLDEL